MRNLKLALRTLFRTPFVTGVAILSLALGIGANAAIFSLFEQIVLRPLPVHQPDRLVNLQNPGLKQGNTSCGQAGSCDAVFSYPMFLDLQRSNTGLSGLAAHRDFGANVAIDGQTMSASAMLVSGSYFPVLGLSPALGRLLTPADDEPIGSNFVAVLSHSFWESRLASDPGVIGKSVIVNDQVMTVIGVAPRGFQGTTLGIQPQIFVPISMRGLMNPGFEGLDDRRDYWAYVFGRLGPGLTVEQAEAGLNAVYRPIIREVEAPLQEGLSAGAMERFRGREIVLEDGRRGQSDVHREGRLPLILLLGTTGVVLLIACANVANLLLARGASRELEMAVRLSLGAKRRQVLFQLLLESSVLAMIGGAASLIVANWTLRFIGSVLPPEASGSIQLYLSPEVLLFTGALALATGLLFGMYPALQATRPELISSIRASAGRTGGTRATVRFRNILVTAQIALSMALLISAGLFIRSLINVNRVDLGVRIDDIVTFGLSPELSGYDPERSATFFLRVEEELATLPGVTGVTAAMVPILAGSSWGGLTRVDGGEAPPDADRDSRRNRVGSGYFRTMGIPLLAGREFTPADGRGAPDVAIVSEAFLRKFDLSREALGTRVGFGNAEPNLEIVGIVRDTRTTDVTIPPAPMVFMPYLQEPRLGTMNFYVRTAGDPEQVMRAVPSVIARLDANLPVEGLKSMPQQVRERVAVNRLTGTLAAAFAALATLLASIGLYGVLAHAVTQRTREIGLRMALGADGSQVRKLILRQVLVMIGIGAPIGVAAAVGLGRAAESILFGVDGADAFSIVAGATLLIVVAMLAGLLPALRASRVDPMEALRYD
jgi:predicted permease